jgi:hypothetical protein
MFEQFSVVQSREEWFACSPEYRAKQIVVMTDCFAESEKAYDGEMTEFKNQAIELKALNAKLTCDIKELQERKPAVSEDSTEMKLMLRELLDRKPVVPQVLELPDFKAMSEKLLLEVSECRKLLDRAPTVAKELVDSKAMITQLVKEAAESKAMLKQLSEDLTELRNRKTKAQKAIELKEKEEADEKAAIDAAIELAEAEAAQAEADSKAATARANLAKAKLAGAKAKPKPEPVPEPEVVHTVKVRAKVSKPKVLASE